MGCLLPSVSLSANRLHVVYYEALAAGMLAHLALATSADKGVTWSRTTLVAETGTYTDNANSTAWLGDYIGLSASGTWVYAIYTDNTTPSSNSTRVAVSCLP
jgi:hypothetical protein